MSEFILAITATLSALMAGLFFSYSFSVVVGLGKLADIDYLKAMQSINKEIQNPVFFLCFFGTIIFLPLVTMLNYSERQTSFWLLLSATLIYLVGVFGVTVFGNVPLNNQLEKVNLYNESLQALSKLRAAFEPRWNLLNNIRTIASIISVILVICACIIYKRKTL